MADWCPILFYGGGKFSGKDLDVNTEIPTPTGTKKLADIKVNDLVFDDRGLPTRVLATSEIFNDHECYELEFSDGSKLIAGEGHRWFCHSKAERVALTRRTETFRSRRRESREKRGVGKRPDLALRNSKQPTKINEAPIGKIRTTKEMFLANDTFTIPLAAPLKYSAKRLKIPPYVLGAWLGDGTSASGGFTSNDQEIVDRIRTLGFEVRKQNSDYGYGILGLKSKLRALGVLNNKHIPSQYLHGSIEQRLELLRGLMDTDGTCSKLGQSQFSNKNPRLIAETLKLMRSLGLKPHLTPKMIKGTKYYNLSTTTTLPIFYLPRKLARIPKSIRHAQKARTITKIRLVPTVQTKCIGVDSPSRLFLAGESCIPTHNTDFLLGDYLQDLATYKEHWQGIIFRRALTEFTEMKLRANELFPQIGGVWKEAKSEWHFPEFGNKDQSAYAILRFRYLESLDDIRLYEGFSMPFIGVDELGDWERPEPFFRLLTMNRYGRFPIPNKRIRATGNPGGRGHVWIKNYFVDPAPLGSVPHYDPELQMQYMFILGTYRDNLIGMSNDPGYENRMNRAGSPELIRALKEGDFSITAGAFYPELGYKNLLDYVEIPHWWTKFCCMDWGACGEGDPFWIGWIAVSDGCMIGVPKGALVVYREYYGKGLPKITVSQVAPRIIEMEQGENIQYRVAGGDIEQQRGTGTSIYEIFTQYGLHFKRADRRRLDGAQAVRELIVGKDRVPNLYFTKNCPGVFQCLQTLQHDPKNGADCLQSNDDPYDGLRYGVMSRPFVTKEPDPIIKPAGIEALTFSKAIELDRRFKQHGRY